MRLCFDDSDSCENTIANCQKRCLTFVNVCVCVTSFEVIH
jgi:hypothetical protein